MQYKLLATDLDGTLLNRRSELSDGVKKAITRLTNSGTAKFVIASGRCYKSISRFEMELGLNVPGGMGIGFNGGMIYETDTLNVLYEHRLKNSVAMEIISQLKKTDGEVLVYIGEVLVSEKENEESISYKNSSKLPMKMFPFDEIKEDVSKILITGSPQVIAQVESHMMPIVSGKLNMFRSGSSLLEICDTPVHKGAGLERLCNMLGIDISEAIAVGDNANDVTMLKAAGLGIAVANADSSAKEAADVVLPFSNDEDAIAKIISEYF